MVARWTIDARFGCKAAALALLSEWVRDVASQAGLGSSHARLLSCQLGGSESSCEMELCFASLAELEAFFAALPTAEHAAWSARLAPVVVDASPRWTVLRTVVQQLQQPSVSVPGEEVQPAMRRSAGGLYIPSTAQETAVEDVELDWKGDPLVRNKGDRMPRCV